MTSTRVVVVNNYKGGSAKTVTSAFLLHVFHALGFRVIGVDADPQASLLNWFARDTPPTDFPMPVIGMATPGLHRAIWGSVDRSRYNLVVIDTPPVEQEAGIVEAAFRVTRDVHDVDLTILVPLAPSSLELDRMPDVRKAIDQATPSMDTPPETRVLLNRTVFRAGSTDRFRTTLTEAGWTVLNNTIPRREQYAGEVSLFPVDGEDPAYLGVAGELLTGWGMLRTDWADDMSSDKSVAHMMRRGLIGVAA